MRVRISCGRADVSVMQCVRFVFTSKAAGGGEGAAAERFVNPEEGNQKTQVWHIFLSAPSLYVSATQIFLSYIYKSISDGA